MKIYAHILSTNSPPPSQPPSTAEQSQPVHQCIGNQRFQTLGIYTTKFDILDTDHPIASIDKLYKGGLCHRCTDTSHRCGCCRGWTPFTSASLADGDLVNVIYFLQRSESRGLTTWSMNSNVVVADTINGNIQSKPVINNGAMQAWITEVV